MADIVAQTADGVQHVFPAGTPDSVVDAAIADYTTKQAPGYQAAKTAADAQMKSPNGEPGGAIDILNGMTSGNADRLLGGVNAAKTAVNNAFTSNPAYTAGDAYTATRDEVDSTQAAYDKAHPVASTAATLAGSIEDPLMKLAGPFIGGAATKIGAAARSALAGSGLGALYGASANKDAPLSGAIAGGVGGAAVGAVAPSLVSGLAKVATVAGDAIQPAASKFVQYGRSILNPTAATDAGNAVAAQTPPSINPNIAAKFAQRYGLTPDKIAQLSAANPDFQSGAPITTAELLGRNAVGDVRALATRSGDAAETVPPLLQQRQYGDAPLDAEAGRFVDNVAESTGIDPRTALADHQAMLDQSRDAVNPAYSAIRANTAPVVQSPEMAAAIADDPKIQAAISAVRANGLNSEATGDPNATQFLQARDLLNRASQFDDTTGRPPNDLVARSNSRAAQTLTQHLNAAVPGFQQATQEAATYKAPEQAFKNASGMLFGSGNGKQLSDVKTLLTNLGTSDEKAAVQRAFMNDILNKENSGGSTRQMLLPGTRQKLAAVFGDDIAGQIQDAALSRSRLAAAAGRMNPNANSVTAESAARSAEQDSLVGDVLGHALSGGAHGGVEGAAKAVTIGLGKRSLAYLQAPQSQAYRDYAIGKLTTPAEEFIRDYVPPAASNRSVLAAPSFAQAGAQIFNQQAQQ